MCPLPSPAYTFSNCVYVTEGDLSTLVEMVPKDAVGVDASADAIASRGLLVSIGDRVFSAKALSKVEQGRVALNQLQRTFVGARLDQEYIVRPFVPDVAKFYASELKFEIAPLRRGRPVAVEINCKELIEEIKDAFTKQVFRTGQQICHRHKSAPYKLTVTSVDHAVLNQQGEKGASSSSGEAMMNAQTELVFAKAADTPIKLTGQSTRKNTSRIMQVNFEDMGIGGLNKEFGDIFRRAFASRIFPSDVIEKMGINHVRGLMLYGPPGCGKTLIARQISKVLQGGGEGGDSDIREPKIVNGPEILNKYVGASEENIRELFKDAEEEQANAGDDSELHVIIFDEIDAICKSRGSSRDSTGVHDSIVNQLLSKIDGVNALNNILLIGMTNRLDMLDSALLRPGRFEVQIEIGLPDEDGRVQILNIHTRKMRNAGYLADDIDIAHLATETKNFSGAEIEGLVKSAASYAFQRRVDVNNLSKPLSPEDLIVEASDFEHALQEVHPAFGVQEDELALCYRNGIVDYSSDFARLKETLMELVNQVKTSDRTPLLSVLLSGGPGSGKTALAASIGAASGFPFVKVISADSLIGMGETSKCSAIAEVFHDAYKSPLSMIIIDDLERLIEFVSIGPRFSNQVLQALLVLTKKSPPKPDRRLLIVGTTSIPHLLEEMELTKVFNVSLPVPMLESSDHVLAVLEQMMQGKQANESPSAADLQAMADACTKPIGIKKLLLVLEMAAAQDGPLSVNRFMECLQNVGF